MASRENQGFQIALIVFVMLTVLLSVTTFVLFRNYNFERTRADASDRTRSEAEQAKAAMKDERDQYLTYMGVSTTEKKEAIDDIWKKDMAVAVTLLPTNLPEDQRTYKKVLDGLQAVVRSKAAENQDMGSKLRDAQANYAAKTAEYEKAKQDLTKEKEEKVKAYEDARTQIATELDQLNISKTKMAEDIAAKEKDWAGKKQQSDEIIAKMNERLGKMQTQIQLKSEDYNKVTSEFNVNSQPDGKIVWVNSVDNLAYINLGSDDLLRKRITFSVYDPSTTDVTSGKSKDAGTPEKNAAIVSSAKKKGTIEVIDITGPHMAECRIVESTNTTPILREDVIFTPLWRPGQQEHFALAGLLDVDGNGVNDRAKIHDIIHQHGGVIDAETDEQGMMKGGVTYSTRYLIKGVNDKAGTKDSGYNQLTSEAAALGVETVDLAKFLDMMGYTPKKVEDKTVLNAKPPTPGQPNTNFRPRTPPPTKAGASGNTGAGY
jgi:Tfp pilus assembly protein PilX